MKTPFASARQMQLPFVLLSLLFLASVPLLSQNIASPPVNEPQVKEEDLPISLQPFSVTAKSDKGYIALRSVAATKTNEPLIDVGHSISVFNSEFVVDSGARTFGDVIRYAANTSGLTSSANRADSDVMIRGFAAATFQDGLGVPLRGATTEFDMTTIDRIEVIKGASAVLYGNSAPGGIVNFNHKRPLAERRYSLSTTIGDYNHYRVSLDATGPLYDGRHLDLNYRTVLTWYDSESFRDGQSWDRKLFQGSLDFRFGNRTNLLVRYQYQLDHDRVNYGKPYIFNVPANDPSQWRLLDLPDYFNRGEIDDKNNFRDNEITNIELTLSHALAATWALKQSLIVSDHYTFRSEVIINDPGNQFILWPRLLQDVLRDTQSVNYEGNLVGEFQTGPVKHKTLFGPSGGGFKALDAVYRFAIQQPGFASIMSSGVLTGQFPIYDARANYGKAIILRDQGPLQLDQDLEIHSSGFGVYVQDNMRLFNDRLILGFGARYDAFNTETIDVRNLHIPGRTVTRTTTETRGTQVSPRYSMLYKVTEQISGYVSYNESFLPAPAGTDSLGNSFPNPTASQIEGGFKFSLNDGRYNATAAWFKNVQDGQTSRNPLTNQLFADGEVTSEGYELEFGMQPLPNWQIIGGFGWIDNAITKNANPTLVGKQFRNIPEFTGALFTRYDFTHTFLKGVSVGLGWRREMGRQGESFSISTAVFQLPDFDIFNLMISYKYGTRWRFALNVENLFDESYITSSSGSRLVQVGDRRWPFFNATYAF